MQSDGGVIGLRFILVHMDVCTKKMRYVIIFFRRTIVNKASDMILAKVDFCQYAAHSPMQMGTSAERCSSSQ